VEARDDRADANAKEERREAAHPEQQRDQRSGSNAFRSSGHDPRISERGQEGISQQGAAAGVLSGRFPWAKPSRA
jgi:hypothetical protein